MPRFSSYLPVAAALLLLTNGPGVAASPSANDQAFEPDSPQAASRRGRGPAPMFKDRLTAHWFGDTNRFWYRNDLPGNQKEFILVDAVRGTRAPAFDHASLARALSQASGTEIDGPRLPFDTITFVDGGGTVAFRSDDKTWLCDLTDYACAETDREIDFPEPDPGNQERRGNRRRGGGAGGARPGRTTSPDGAWTALVRDNNVFVRSQDGMERQLSQDGSESQSYSQLEWSPNGSTLVAWRVEPGEDKEVHLLQSSPPDGGRARVSSRTYPLPGDRMATYEPNLFDPANGMHTKPDVVRLEHQWLRPRIRWNAEGTRFAYEQVDRGHQRLRVIEIDARNGETRNLIDERSETFIWTAHTENLNLRLVNWLERSEEILYVSESNGWRHLYLVDAVAGRLKHAITSGEWVIRGIDRIDEEARQVWFHASGVFSDQDPYLLHYGRVNFDGSGLTWLTAGNGQHRIEYSPDRRFLIDSYSRADMAPRHELRRVSDGGLICDLDQADVSQLEAEGWEPPEVFVAKGRDGVTDIWGLIHRPRDLDPDRSYPIIEDIYAGPQGSFVPKSFSASGRYGSLTRRGFVVVKIDGMGTANRSKAFHDVCWHNLKDGGFADRILWMQAAARKYPYLDLERVGVYGNSAGGQNAAAAVLFHPEFYKVAVASCGCHDNRMDKASWNEQWMGYMPPDKLWESGPDNWYSQCSNIDNAHRLQGKLFLIVGEMDNNVPPESTLRLVDALIRADKNFDLLVIPNGGHGMGGAYGQRRMEAFFARHLQGPSAPDTHHP